MQLVPEKYYYIYRNLTAIISFLIVGGSVASYFLEPMIAARTNTGLTFTTGVFAGLHVIYVLISLLKQKVGRGVWYSEIIGAMFFSMTILIAINAGGGSNSPIFYAWVLLVLVSGLFGKFAIAGSLFTITFYFIVSREELWAKGNVDPSGFLPLAICYLAGAISWVIFTHVYTTNDTDRVQQLSGMLRNKQQQTDILIQAISDAIIVINNDGKIGLMNPAAAKMTEWSLEEATGIEVETVLKLKTEDGKDLDPKDNPFNQVLQEKSQINATFQLISRNNKTHVVSCAISPLIEPEEQIQAGAVAVVRDVSAAKAEERRRADFISTASHEMRTPVAAIEGYLSLVLNDNVSQIDNKARQYIEKARASTQHLGKLFQDLLTSAKAEDGRLVSHPEIINIGEFLEQLVDSLKFSAEKKGLLIDYKVGVNSAETGNTKVIAPLYFVKADPDRLREVITNIFDNAVKYTDSGKITIGLTGNNEVVQFFVQDTGPGIPEEDIPHLFQKFYRVDNTATRTIGGTGLGLFICRKIVELYNGHIWVESESGKGSTFYINMPRISQQKATEFQKTQERSEIQPSQPAQV